MKIHNINFATYSINSNESEKAEKHKNLVSQPISIQSDCDSISFKGRTFKVNRSPIPKIVRKTKSGEEPRLKPEVPGRGIRVPMDLVAQIREKAFRIVDKFNETLEGQVIKGFELTSFDSSHFNPEHLNSKRFSKQFDDGTTLSITEIKSKVGEGYFYMKIKRPNKPSIILSLKPFSDKENRKIYEGEKKLRTFEYTLLTKKHPNKKDRVKILKLLKKYLPKLEDIEIDKMQKQS